MIGADAGLDGRPTGPAVVDGRRDAPREIAVACGAVTLSGATAGAPPPRLVKEAEDGRLGRSPRDDEVTALAEAGRLARSIIAPFMALQQEQQRVDERTDSTSNRPDTQRHDLSLPNETLYRYMPFARPTFNHTLEHAPCCQNSHLGDTGEEPAVHGINFRGP